MAENGIHAPPGNAVSGEHPHLKAEGESESPAVVKKRARSSEQEESLDNDRDIKRLKEEEGSVAANSVVKEETVPTAFNGDSNTESATQTSNDTSAPVPPPTTTNGAHVSMTESEVASAPTAATSNQLAAVGDATVSSNDATAPSEAAAPTSATGDAADPSQASSPQGIVDPVAQAAQDATTASAPGTGVGMLQSPPIQMRCLIVTQDASIIIGKAGRHVNEIREKSGARVTISEAISGNPERILNVAGPLDAVSKAFGLVVRRINDEPYDMPSVPGSKAVTIRFIIPNSRMGSVIGKAGSKIKEIQDASGARLQASEAMLPGSTERILSVSGVADAVHIAVYYIGMVIQEHAGASTATNQSYRPAGGSASGSRGGYSGSYGRDAYTPSPAAPAAGYGTAASSAPGSQTQQIFIPNELVGCIIGKGGSKINEIRQMSGSHIKILEPGEGGGGANGERLVVITGQQANIQMAVQLLAQRLEIEKNSKGAPRY